MGMMRNMVARRPRIAVHHKQGHGVWALALDVHEMDADAIHVGLEMGELVDASFCFRQSN